MTDSTNRIEEKKLKAQKRFRRTVWVIIVLFGVPLCAVTLLYVNQYSYDNFGFGLAYNPQTESVELSGGFPEAREAISAIASEGFARETSFNLADIATGRVSSTDITSLDETGTETVDADEPDESQLILAECERTEPTRHVIRQGDNIGDIATTYCVHFLDIIAVNDHLGTCDILIGNTLSIPVPTTEVVPEMSFQECPQPQDLIVVESDPARNPVTEAQFVVTLTDGDPANACQRTSEGVFTLTNETADMTTLSLAFCVTPEKIIERNDSINSYSDLFPGMVVFMPLPNITTTSGGSAVVEQPTVLECPTRGYDYTVQSGDTLGAIARANCTKVLDLKILNDIPMDSDVINVGQLLYIPGPGEFVQLPADNPQGASAQQGQAAVQELLEENPEIELLDCSQSTVDNPLGEGPTRYTVVQGNSQAQTDPENPNNTGTYPAHQTCFLAESMVVHMKCVSIGSLTNRFVAFDARTGLGGGYYFDGPGRMGVNANGLKGECTP